MAVSYVLHSVMKGQTTLHKLCAFSVRICIPGETHPHPGEGTSPFSVRISPFPMRICIPIETHPPFPVRMCIPGEAHPHSRRGCAFLVRMNYSGMNILTENAYPHREWGCASLGMHIFAGNGMYLTGNAYPHWDCT